MVSPDRLIYQRASRPSLYKDLILFCWLTGSENNSLYVYNKKVSDPMLSYKFNVSMARSILVSLLEH